MIISETKKENKLLDRETVIKRQESSNQSLKPRTGPARVTAVKPSGRVSFFSFPSKMPFTRLFPLHLTFSMYLNLTEIYEY